MAMPRGGAQIGARARSWSTARTVLAGLAATALAAGWIGSEAFGRASSRALQGAERPGEFELIRVEYPSSGGAQEAYYYAYGRLWQRWETDYPEGDQNFSRRLGQLTRVVSGAGGTSRKLSDPDLFEYPFLYGSDVGWMQLGEAERAGLREYLLRGGFLWVDDFWGDAEWENFAREMQSVFPGLHWRDLPNDHPILHTVFDLPETPQVPARDFGGDEFGREPRGLHRTPVGSMEPAHLRGYFDAAGRLLVVATHNTDLGDGFEREAYGQFYFERYSTRAYALGANIVLYALTH
jgi:hypothetical protein